MAHAKGGLRIPPRDPSPRVEGDGIALDSAVSPDFLLTGNFLKMVSSTVPKDK